MKKTLLSAAAFVIHLCTISAQTTQTFNFTGSVQTFTVPACVTSMTVDCRGARGGGTGGLGGRVQGVLTVTPGMVLNIYVGGQGGPEQSLSPGGFNGGGTAGQVTNIYPGAGGGGASDIRINGNALTDRVIVAGGGGGSHQINSPGNAGAGGGLVGGNVVGNGNTCMGSWATGGTQSAGGNPSTWSGTCCSFTPVPGGSFGQGGNGAGPASACNGGDGGAGGGGGWYGGGGGGTYTAGGGGSSYTNPSLVSGVTHTQGFQTGNGQIIITYTPGPPAAAGPITGPVTVCAGGTYTYSITPINGATSYNWTVPTGAVINSGQGTTSVSVTFGSTSGNITVTPSNSCGSSAPSSISVTVSAAPVVALGSDITQCGGSAVLNAQNPGSSYLWSTGATTQTITVSSSGTYSVVVTNGAGCTGSDAINVTINTPPTVALGSDITQCGGTALLDAQNSGSTFLWSNNATTQTITVSSSGTYSVTVTASNGCTGTDAINVTINTPPTVALGSDITQCGGTVMLDAQNPGSTYLWSDNSTGQTLTVSSSGSYSVTVTDVNGCTGTDAINVTINTPPTVALGSDITQCGGTVMLDAQNGGSTYLWSDNSTNQTLIVSSSGTYSVIVTDGNGCTGTDVIIVTINSNPIVSLSLNPSTVCITIPAYALTGGSPSGGTYSGNGVSGGNFDPAAAGLGSHTITYVYTDSNGCIDSATQVITVDACTGMDQQQQFAGLVQVYPNPSNGVLYFTCPLNNASLEFIITDVRGKVVYRNTVAARTTQGLMDVSGLASGTYFLKITAGDNSKVQKLVISK